MRKVLSTFVIESTDGLIRSKP